ncbi:unnamed protein product [Caenorhabditis sp. 36 PRJEB53466]|nr:unnamed protein product [Caenorhabditis sp. 36 PRJEB53466]
MLVSQVLAGRRIMMGASHSTPITVKTIKDDEGEVEEIHDELEHERAIGDRFVADEVGDVRIIHAREVNRKQMNFAAVIGEVRKDALFRQYKTYAEQARTTLLELTKPTSEIKQESDRL